MVALTDESTASAAELFTQALRDYGVAKSVGTTTYGKGVMQVTHSLKDGSAVRITVAKYNPPKSENYDGVGIKPDYEVTLSEDQQKNFDNLDETTDPQLQKALELVKTSPSDQAATTTSSEDTAADTAEEATTTEETSDSTEETTTTTEETSESTEESSTTESTEESTTEEPAE